MSLSSEYALPESKKNMKTILSQTAIVIEIKGAARLDNC